jgi:hypothetical protein
LITNMAPVIKIGKIISMSLITPPTKFSFTDLSASQLR